MLIALLIVTILVWLALLAYLAAAPLLGTRWSRWGAAGIAVAALALSGTYAAIAPRQRRQETIAKRYWAGIDERQRGNLEEAEKQFEQVLSIDPGNTDARRQLEEIRQERPAERRIQEREARVDRVPSPSGQPSPTPPPGNQPVAQPPPPEPIPGTSGQKPKPYAHRPSPFEITHYALDTAIDPAAHVLDATATIRIRSRSGTVKALDFSLNPEFKPKSAQLDGAPAPFKHTNDLFTVTPARPLEPGREATVTVRYRREGKALVGEGEGLISPQGTYFLSESRWYPATGELDFRSPVRVRATVPSEYTVVSVGQLKGKTVDGKSATYHWETDRLASMVSLAAAKYVQESLDVQPPAGITRPPLKITCYTFPQHRDRAGAFLKEASGIVRFLEKKLGAYPYEKLGIVEIPLFPGGYGTTSFVMLIDKSFALKKVPREFLAHEIAHQWWGNSVFPQGLGAAWLTEAFANYSAWCYDEAVTGNPRVLRKRVARAVSLYFEAARVKGDQPIYEADPYQHLGASQATLYEKGAVVLHMLRRQLGDEAFWKTIRAHAERHRFGKAKIEDFRKVAEEVSGQELGWFFDQWLGRTGGMAFAYTFATQPDTKEFNRAVILVTQAKPAYRGKMKVVLDVENRVETHEVELTSEEHSFTFPVKGKLTNVLFDPEGTYLMRPPKWVVPDG
jgi:aminopeptidase N